MAITIYKVNASPPARAVLMVAEILKLKYETKEVNIMAGDHIQPEYLEKNPLHTVPVLEDGDFVLVDSHAIITYLTSKYGADHQEKLYPRDLLLRATIDQRLYFEATVLFIIARSIVRDIKYKKLTNPSDGQIAEANEAYGVLEKYLQKSKFVACDHLTLPDVSCVATVSSLDVLVPVDKKFEKVHAWFNRLKSEEWYQKMNVPGLTQFASLLKMLMEKNKA